MMPPSPLLILEHAINIVISRSGLSEEQVWPILERMAQNQKDAALAKQKRNDHGEGVEDFNHV